MRRWAPCGALGWVCCIIHSFDAKVLYVLRVLVRSRCIWTTEVRFRKRNHLDTFSSPGSSALFSATRPWLGSPRARSNRVVRSAPCSAPPTDLGMGRHCSDLTDKLQPLHFETAPTPSHLG